MLAGNGILVLINRTGMLFLLGTIVYQCPLLAVLMPWSFEIVVDTIVYN